MNQFRYAHVLVLCTLDVDCPCLQIVILLSFHSAFLVVSDQNCLVSHTCRQLSLDCSEKAGLEGDNQLSGQVPINFEHVVGKNDYFYFVYNELETIIY